MSIRIIRLLFAIATIFTFSFISDVAFGEEQDVTVPCQFPFDASKMDSVLSETFLVQEYRNYEFSIQFEYNQPDMDRVRNIIGTGTYKVFTKESADTDHPVLVLADSSETETQYVVRLNAGLKSGSYVMRPTDFSGEIPVDIGIFKLEENQTHPIKVLDRTVRTIGYFAHGFLKFDEKATRINLDKPDGGYFERLVIAAALKPGRYQVKVHTVGDETRFSGIPMRFVIESTHNEQQLNQ